MSRLVMKYTLYFETLYLNVYKVYYNIKKQEIQE